MTIRQTQTGHPTSPFQTTLCPAPGLGSIYLAAFGWPVSRGMERVKRGGAVTIGTLSTTNGGVK